MTSVLTETVILLLLIVANGVFAMAEMAIVSARKARLQQLADEGDSGAGTALQLAEEPEDLLSTVQIGITLIGVMAGAFGGATIARELAGALGDIPFLAPYAEAIGVAIVVLLITYLSLVIGELAPKRLALYNAERIASRIASPMDTLSRIASPLARFLSLSAETVLRVLGIHPASEPPVTEEEIKILIEEGTEFGVFEPFEEELVDHVFRLADRKVSAMITPRTEIVWIDVDDSTEEIQRKVIASGHSRFPVAQGSLDHVFGAVLVQDLLCQSLSGQAIDLKTLLKRVPFVPENTPALEVLNRFKDTHSEMAFVLDEYGGLQGLVTTADILLAIVGEISGLGEAEEERSLQRADGSWLMDGLLPLDELQELFDLEDLPAAGTETLGGLVMALLGRVPSAGDHCEWGGLRFEVMDMDRHRVDKVLVVPSEPPTSNGEGEL
jgi:putative hemolysin